MALNWGFTRQRMSQKKYGLNIQIQTEQHRWYDRDTHLWCWYVFKFDGKSSTVNIWVNKNGDIL